MTQKVALMRRWAVSCRQVTKEFGDGESLTPVLRGVDFDARCGELTLLVGPSGCGKTTLLSVLTAFSTRPMGTSRFSETTSGG